jgi:hypothetical protein
MTRSELIAIVLLGALAAVIFFILYGDIGVTVVM